ncbi:cyclin-dependent kinase G-2 isoform X1 [Iris pallida]|uniref:Cyclin-dependent kinase G-2 isoform X1 n=1 Tax=Iris pallida TaxID=29817 RepID=A0AAX6GLD9_IRIPA|nr:cyclin-dependent kinase G-2 isoform X1 [Iris pallida]KAJ6829609.1 cyclin-dependent kinase G-2 isoform X1 [Iris pallida]
MAAGRHGGYRDHELRDRESNLEVSRRTDYYGDRERAQSHDIRSRVRVSNGGRGNSQKGSRLSGKVADREPGELSSGSGEEEYEAPVNDSRVSRSGSNGFLKEDKKRKFSPIVWDRNDSKQQQQQSNGVSSRSKSSDVPLPLPPPPPLPRGFVASNSMDTRVLIDSPQDPLLGDDREPGQVEEDYFPLTRHISSSRWANNDESEALDEEVVPKKRKTPPSVSEKKVLSPDLGEVVVKREGSEGAQSRSSGSDRENRVEGHRNDYMDVDSEDGSGDDQKDGVSDDESEDGDDRAKSADPPQRSINMLQGCRSVDEFERLNKIDEGTYGIVYRAQDKKTGEIVALKKVKMEKEREGFPLTSLREINILLSFHHPSIVDVKEVVVGSSLDSIFMVMEYMEHDLKGLMETMKQPFSQSEVKCLMLQLLAGVKYLHDNWVLHRDLKTSNILMNNRGELKICDFGLSRQYGSPLKPYTQLVVTLWYRSPELLLGAKEYSTAIDMWSLGCIMAELLAKEPLFSGKTEVDQLDKIFRTLGTPNEKIWPGFSKLPRVKVNFVRQPYNKLREKFPPTSFSGRPTLSEAGFDLLNKLLTYDPEKRITAEAALNHSWFTEVPLPKSKDFMPTFPAQHAQDRRLRRIMKSPDPLEEQRRKELQQGDQLGSGSLFC